MNRSFDGTRPQLRIEILRAARFVLRAIVAPAHALGHRLVAVAARDLERAQLFATQYQVERTYVSYQELIGDLEINVIYNALHNGANAPWNIRVL